MKARLPDLGSRRLFHRPLMRRPAWIIEHLLRLQELAELSGQTFNAFVEGPASEIDRAELLVVRIRRALARKRASSQKQGLLDLATLHERTSGGPLGSAVVAGLRAYAIERAAPRGNPSKLRGAAANQTRIVVNAAIDQLVSEHLAKDLGEQQGFAWLFECGRPGRPSPGHRAIVLRAGDLAEAAGKPVSEWALSRQVTEATRAVREFNPSRWVLGTARNRLARTR